MGLFWDLYQQTQISRQGERSATIEARLEHLENQVDHLTALLHEIVGRLEKHVGVDLDEDGRVG